MSVETDRFVNRVFFSVVLGSTITGLLGWLFGLSGGAALLLFFFCVFGTYFILSDEDAKARAKNALRK